MISNCGHNEWGGYHGGQAGDQTGGEYSYRSWYNRPWNHVLRPATSAIGTTLARVAKAAALNNKVGYDQDQRTTYYNRLREAGWEPANITTACEADCSASTAANVIATGHILGLTALQNISPSLYSGNIRNALTGAGFTDLTASKYLTSDTYLLPGDVLLYENHHVAINVTAGSQSGANESYPNGEGTGPDGTANTDIVVNHSAVKAEAGTYDVTYSAGGASVTVKVKVVASGETPSSVFRPDYDTISDDASVIDQLEDIYADTNFAYPGWEMNMSETAEDTVIDYVYSRQNKLEALTKTMELTDDLFWRVRFVNEKVVDISEFGEKKDWIISVKPSGVNNIRLIEEPQIEWDFENVINMATVYSEKSDSGMSSMTLREVYNDPDLQKDGFPVVILRSNANNERDYTKYVTQYPKLAPNNELEFAVIDEESVALEGGTLIEGTYAFNDLSPFNNDTDKNGNTREIKDKDRIKAAKTAYKAAIRKLKQARRSYKLTPLTEEFPAEIAPGDRVRFIYDNSVYILDSCSNYQKKILSYDDWFYVTGIHYSITTGGVETNEITLEKWLHIDRDNNQ